MRFLGEEHESRTHFSGEDISICPHHATCDSIPPSVIIFTKKEREREKRKTSILLHLSFPFLIALSNKR